MNYLDGKIHWAARISPKLLVDLYIRDANGQRDETLADEVGCALFARCEDILAASQAFIRAKCPNCGAWIHHAGNSGAMLECPCGFAMCLRDYMISFKNKDLQGGGAVPVFERFIAQYSAAKDYTAKIYAIDSMIHAFHYELQGGKKLNRCAATCVIHSVPSETLRILNNLAYSTSSTAGLQEEFMNYQAKLKRSTMKKPK